jgi:hypothetical protein
LHQKKRALHLQTRRTREEQRQFFASTLEEIARRHKGMKPENTDADRRS